MPRILLNCIVRNESARIVRMLESVAPHIIGAVICDTGSTDDTPKIIAKFLGEKGIPGSIVSAPFIDWSQARNAALAAARASQFDWDYLLLMDADMELKVLNPEWMDARTGPSYDMFQNAGTLHYQNRRLIHKSQAAIYHGVTHEYLGVESAGCIPDTAAYFIDHADGANRPQKFKRDIKLLKQGIKDEPKNERYFYYLAQSYRDAGKPAEAAKWYKRRVDAGGWDEEVWSAQQNYAQCLKDMGDISGFTKEMIAAYNMRPSRAETLYDLAKYYREKGESAASLLFSEPGMEIPLSQDALFVNRFIYEVGVKDEFAISAFYVPSKRAKGFDVCNELSLKVGPYAGSRDLARSNMLFYIKPLKEIAPSFEWKKIAFTPYDGWTAMNPSVTVHDDKLWVIIRTVNYKMDNDGRYYINGNPLGALNDDNPIRTRSFLMRLNDELEPISHSEILPPSNMPAPLFGAVLGFEDMRLFSYQDSLWTSSTVREMNAGGVCEQVLARLKVEHGAQWYVDDNWMRMLHEPREYEKNWAPIANGQALSFMYRPGEVVNISGDTAIKHEPKWDTGQFSGGSQVIRFQDGYLAIIHEARHLPGSSMRYYTHRFVYYAPDFSVRKISKMFVFNEKMIEFCAGMCWHPTKDDTLVMSYGFKDEEARIGTISREDVSRMLWR